MWMGIGAIKFKKIANHNILISTYRPTIYMATRGGTGMKNQVLVESGSGPRKTLPENTCISSEVIHRRKGLEYVSSTTQNFPWPQNFSAFLSCVELQINQYCL